VQFHEKGWSIEVPVENELTSASANRLERVANRLQKKDLVELLLRDWLGWSFEHRIRFASGLTIPRDYHWLSMLAAVERDFIMVDYVMAGIGGFDAAEVREMIRWAEHNHREYGYDRLLLAFIAERVDLLDSLPDPDSIPGVKVEFVPLLLDVREQPTLREVGKEGKIIAFYDNGETLDDWVGQVERNINRSES
jgi:hypothetical protein